MSYRTYVVTIDMSEATEGDFIDFRRDLDRLEENYPGVHLLGTQDTDGWPTFTIKEARFTPEAP